MKGFAAFKCKVSLQNVILLLSFNKEKSFPQVYTSLSLAKVFFANHSLSIFLEALSVKAFPQNTTMNHSNF